MEKRKWQRYFPNDDYLITLGSTEDFSKKKSTGLMHDE